MFYYYGRKSAIAHLYPTASYDTIIEPFAGSAAYSLLPHHRNKAVILVEKDPAIAELWRWLIHTATPEDIVGLGEIAKGQRTSELLLILHSASKRWFTYKSITATKVLADNWNRNRLKMVALLPYIKHWTLIEGSYEESPDVEATWFIDPPYYGDPGTGYRFGSDQINYASLASWCKQRHGQIIVCEGEAAEWLPFEPFTSRMSFGGKRHNEFVWVANQNPQGNTCLSST